jgi:hypothetical protein
MSRLYKQCITGFDRLSRFKLNQPQIIELNVLSIPLILYSSIATNVLVLALWVDRVSDHDAISELAE